MIVLADLADDLLLCSVVGWLGRVSLLCETW